MKTNRSLQTKPFTQFIVPPQAFDAFNKELPIQEALGSTRTQGKREAADIRSVNYVPDVSGWRLTPQGLELGASSGVFPPGTVTFVDIQNISTDKILGRDTAGDGVIEQLGLGAGLSISGGNLILTAGAYTDEQAQDAVGNILADTGDVDFTYNDATPDIVASVKTTVLNSDVYTPTRSAESNLDANVTMTEAQYMRVRNTVTVSGRFTADATAGGLASFEITLPVASNIGAVEDVAGVASSVSATTFEGAEVIGVVANDTAKISWIAVDTTSRTWSYQFSYQII